MRIFCPCFWLLAGVLFLFSPLLQAQKKTRAVFVIGTPHYEPKTSMPPLAALLQKEYGFKTTIVSTDYDAEKNPKGIPGLEVLTEADVAVFFLRFLTLPEDQLAHIQKYLESGKPVVGFRTSTHAFAYPEGHPLEKWNDDFGKLAMGSKYFMHGTEGTVVKKGKNHAVLRGLDFSIPWIAAGNLYLSDLPKDAKVVLTGTGKFKRTGKIINQFGTHQIKAEMTEDLAWVWTNQWGGRVFGTTLGHPKTFENENMVRLAINGIHWAAGKPVPGKGKSKRKTVSGKQTGTKSDVGSGKGADMNKKKNTLDAKNTKTGKALPPQDPELAKYGIYATNAPNPKRVVNRITVLPLTLKKGTRIAFVGNTLLDRAQDFGFFETMLQQAYPDSELFVRNFAWSADEIDLQPRPDNFATVFQHLTREKIDVVFAAFGYNESFAGKDRIDEFKARLTTYLNDLRSSAFNGETGPQIVLISPIANENIAGVPAADINNERLALYTKAMAEVTAGQGIGFANVFEATHAALADPKTDLTINGAHLTEKGYAVFAEKLFSETFGKSAPDVNEEIRSVVVDKNRQYFRRYRPLNTFYYTGGRKKGYGYLDFLPAMRNFEIMTANREDRIHDLVKGKTPSSPVDDSNVPPLEEVIEARGANEWMSPKDELAAFTVDPRFEVNLFASEEEFPDIACPIQMRWDGKGRLWVSCSTVYPHVYPGNEPNDKIVILEDTDKDGKADKSTVFADDLQIPLAFVLTENGILVSEEPHLSLIEDTDGDGKADKRTRLLTGFGCEDSHHALHDLVWTPGGDLLFRESIFHNSQVETPYGPIRAKNSAWFSFRPSTQRLVTFGNYPNTNPWGVTFDDWGNHVASHPIFASAFHSLNPPYPNQQPKALGIPAYSGVCGHEFVDFPMWPEEMQGGFVKVRYKPTNRVEFHKWVKKDDHYAEEYQTDLIFSKNLSFIPVDLKYGPRGAMYICDWYNPVKGHMQYALRDPRRDRKSGRIWRITPKGAKLQEAPPIAGADLSQLLDNLKRPEYRYRYWTRNELRYRDHDAVAAALDLWVKELDSDDPRYRHHQVEAIWAYRTVDKIRPDLLADVLDSNNADARAAATKQLRFWFDAFPDKGISLLTKSANDDDGIVRMEAIIAASYLGTKEALEAVSGVFEKPMGDHLKFAAQSSLISKNLVPHWQGNEEFAAKYPAIANFAKNWDKHAKLVGTIKASNAIDTKFDKQTDLKTVKISCVPERMMFTKTKFKVRAGQPVKIIFTNPDATQHNLVIVQPGALEEVGMGGNEMAKDPSGIEKGFIPENDKILHHTKLIDPEAGEVLRFKAPEKPGVYPYLCTFPGHWIIMKGEMTVE